MATYYTITQAFVSSGVIVPGTLVDDSSVLYTQLLNAGVMLRPSSDVDVAAAAARASLRLRSASATYAEMEEIMLVGVNASANALLPNAVATNQISWDVDPVNGLDTNSGIAGSGFPIKTLVQLSKRMRSIRTGVNGGYLINLLNNVPSTDAFCPSGWMVAEPTANSNPFGFIFTLQGVRTTLATGTMTANAAVQSPSTSVRPTVTDSSVTDWTPYIGKLLVTTSGSQVNGRVTILKDRQDLAVGCAEVSRWSGAVNATPPSSGATYKIVEYTQLPAAINLQGAPIGTYAIIDCCIPSTTPAANLLTIRPGINVSLTTCRIEQAMFGGIVHASRIALDGSCIKLATATTVWSVPGNVLALTNSSMINGEIQLGDSCRLLINSFLMESANIRSGKPGTSGDAGGGGMMIAVGADGLGVFNAPATKSGVMLQSGAKMKVVAPLFGAGNARYGVEISEGSNLMIQSTITPTLTGTLGNLLVEGQTTLEPPRAAGAAIPGSASCDTWVKWRAVPFSGNVKDTATGFSQIITVT